jgi:FSR family fosmidomycin resistance protein-like MFS transporter
VSRIRTGKAPGTGPASRRQAAGSEKAIASRERNILAVTAIAHFLAHLYMLVFPSLALVLKSALDLPLHQVLALSFWMYLFYGLGALPAGILTDLYRPRLMLAICLLGMGGSAVVASRAASPQMLRWALAALGLSASIYHPAGMALISRGVRRRGWALGFNGVFGNLGVVSAPFLAGLLAVAIGWRHTYLVLALPGLAAGLLAIFLPVEGEAEPHQPVPSGEGRRRRILQFGLLAMAMMLGGIAYRGQTLILPAYFEQRIGFLIDRIGALGWLPEVGRSTLAATTLTSLAYLGGAWGQVVGGRLADRHDLRVLYIIFHAASLPLLLLMGFLGRLPLLLVAVAYAFFGFGMQPIENSLVAALTPTRLRSTGYGLKFILTFGMGSLAVQLVGRWQQQGGLAAVFPWLAGCVAMLLVFAGLLWLATRGERLDQAGGMAEQDEIMDIENGEGAHVRTRRLPRQMI